MEAGVFSLYWDNIDPRLPAAQKAVFEKLGLPVKQHKIDGLPHGDWIDFVMNHYANLDVLAFLDIDCVPLKASRFREVLYQAGEGSLIGAAGAANHLDPTRDYAGAWFVAINRRLWERLGRPSARSDLFCDVCQRWTDIWRISKATVRLLYPTHVTQPKWQLPSVGGVAQMDYGIGTFYGDYCFHLFESSSGGANVPLFLAVAQKAIDDDSREC